MEKEINTEVQNVTKQTLLELPAKERAIVLKKYHKWLKDVRQQDKMELLKEKSRINRFKAKKNKKRYRE